MDTRTGLTLLKARQDWATPSPNNGPSVYRGRSRHIYIPLTKFIQLIIRVGKLSKIW